MRKTSLLPARQLTPQARKEGQGIFTVKGALPLVLRAFLFGEKFMRAAVMENKSIKTDEAEKKSFVNLFGAVGGIVGGFILALSGLILSVISFFTRIKFNSWEVILIATAFVFFAIGAHFLDLMDRENKAKRKQKLNL